MSNIRRSNEIAIIEINDFPFFSDSFSYETEMETETIHSFASSVGRTFQSGPTYTGSFVLGGMYIEEEINRLIFTERGTPKPLDLRVTVLNDELDLRFEETLLTYLPDDEPGPLLLQFTASEVAIHKDVNPPQAV